MIKPGILEKQAKIVYLGIGSNLGNRINNIEKAKNKLSDNVFRFLICNIKSISIFSLKKQVKISF